MDAYFRPKDVPGFLLERFRYDISLHTVRRWRRRHPLPNPATLSELEQWFEICIHEKRRAGFALAKQNS